MQTMRTLLRLAAPLALCPSMLATADGPKVVTRKATPCLGIRSKETMQSMATLIPRLMPLINAHLSNTNTPATGPVFVRFHVIDMAKQLEVEVGIPVANPGKGGGRVKPGLLPAGKYVSYSVTGHYRELVMANAELQNWAKKKGLSFDMKQTPKGSAWAARAEFYLTDPEREPDPKKWKAEIVYRLKG